ncbi:immunoglobulin domain-containing protein [Candidatus Bipolaricaulota bacterium]|nr:immunoglobulin domain-containing protein [Candidatus Bipolaricaulota bacterium]
MRAVAVTLVVIGIGALLAGCDKGTPPTITTPPQGETICAGGAVTFSVAASGTAPLTYQWAKDGTAIPGATSSSYTINPVSASDAGTYTVTVRNAAGSATSSAATLTVNVPPTLSAHPPTQTACAGSSVLMSATADGTPPLSYQWRKDGAALAGATTAVLSLPAVTRADAGAYTVVVTNACGSVTSEPALLTVGEAPTIVAQPGSHEAEVGTEVTFTAVATGQEPLLYQWRKDGTDIQGATGPTFTLPAAAADDAGTYTVVVTNGCGSVTSEPAVLSVTPTATPQPATEPTAAPAESSAFITVNGHPLSRDAFDAMKEQILGFYQQLYGQFGMDVQVLLVGARGRMFELELELSALTGLVTRGIVEGEAAKRDIAISPDEIEAEFERQYQAMLETYGITEEYLIEYFAAQGGTLDEFKDEGRASVAEQLLYEEVQTAVVGPVELTEDDLRQYFEDHKADYSKPEEIRASHILVATADEAQAVLDELALGADFAELARERSTCPSSAEGGDLGWFSRGKMVPEFEEAAFALAVGETSGIVESQFGFHIILVTDRREASEPTFEEVADRVRADAEAALVRERFDAWLNEVRRNAVVVIDDPILQAMYVRSADLDQGIAAFERIREEGKVEEPYISFIIGSLYEEKMADLESDKELLETEFPEGPEREAQIAALDEAIDAARQAALAAYRRALEELPGDEDVLERIAALEGAAALPR